MNFRSGFTVFLVLLVFSLHGQQQHPKPKLVVGIVVDQMCYDYLFRFYDQFGTDGFRRLMDNGSHFRNVTYNYVPTFTGPGHASIYTGTTPSNHGIAANDWFERSYGREVNCVEDTMVKPVGTDSPDGRCSPHFLRANTITDQLKLTYPKGKVISASIKDRSAILPAGHLADGAYWYDYQSGKFITSTFYRKELPAWVTGFYTSNPVDTYLGKVWDLSRPTDQYQYANQDNSPYEQLLGTKTTPVFPYDFTKEPVKWQVENFPYMPFANTYLTDFAIKAMTSEELGKDSWSDMLTISYSSPDYVGHAFGPYSLEMEDMYLRLDLEIARLLKALDEQAGKGNYVVFLTADHAAVPVPQFLVDKQLPGGYLFLDKRMAELRAASVTRFGEDVIEKVENNNLYLKSAFKNGEKQEEYLAFLQGKIAQWPEVKSVYTIAQLSGMVTGDNWLDMVRSGFDKEHSGELIFLLQPGYLPKSTDSEKARKGTSHGSAFNYDTHVPVLFYGAGIPKQEIFTPYQVVDIAASLVHILQVQRPNAMTGKPMLELFR